MKRAILLSVSILTLATMASADDSRAGTKGHVTAYDSDRFTVFDVDSCPRKRLSWDYMACGKSFRDKVKERLCNERGQGKHKWFYRVGDSKVKTSNTAICK